MEPCTLAAVFVIGLVQHVSSYSNAKRMWQLGDTAAAWEHNNGYDAIYPALSDPVKVASGHPSLNFKAFSFDGVSDYVHVDNYDNNMFKTFSILMFVNPASNSGPLLHYKYRPVGQDGIDSVKVTAVNGDIEAELVYNSNTWSDVITAGLVTSEWQYVLVSRNMDTGIIGLDVNGSAITFAGAHKDTVQYLGSPGELWFGRNHDTGDLYKGKMTCVLFFDYVFSPSELVYAYNECNGLSPQGVMNVIDVDAETDTTTTTATTTTTSPETTTTTTATTTTTSTPETTTTLQMATTTTPTPVSNYVMWLLDERTYAYQTDGSAPVYPMSSQCCRLAGASPDTPSRESVLLDGSSKTYFDLPLAFGFLQGDFQIAFKVYGGYPSSGTILHFMYTGTELGIREVHLSVSSGQMLLAVQDATHECGTLIPGSDFSSDVWLFVIIERQSSQLKLHLDSSSYTSTDSCSAGPSGDASQGVLRLGNSATLDDPLRGQITCLGVYDSVLTGTERKTQHNTLCTTTSISVPSLDMTLCFQIPHIRHVQYSLHASDKVPDVGQPPVVTSQTISLRHCGRMCIETRHCLAFTYSEANDAGRKCSLYDYVTRGEGLAMQQNSNYYVITN